MRSIKIVELITEYIIRTPKLEVLEFDRNKSLCSSNRI